ncbi:MAG TPA: hypothetical protein VFG79_01875, partial [Solirubrobacter sp.]|nr:hypothetical protein [Solirubrobacter sp.]
MAAQADVAAKLIERLLADPAFRARFRRDPAGACREAGLEELAQEMSLGAGKAMHTLDIRESKSSLAGVMMAAAMEGVGIYQFTENVLPHLEEVPGAVADVLSRVDLPAIDLGALRGGGGGGSAAAADAVTAPPSSAPGAADAGVPVDGAAAGTPPPPAAPPPPPPPPEAPEAKGADAAAAADAPKPKATPPPEAAKEDAAAKQAAEKIAKQFSPEAAEKQAKQDAAAALDEQTSGLPESSDLPTGESAATEGVPADAAAPPDTALPDAPPAAAPPDTELPDAPPAAAPPDTALPTQAPEHLEGVPVDTPGGAPDSETLALLKNKNVVFDADVKTGRIDPRVVGVLTKLGEEHKI